MRCLRNSTVRREIGQLFNMGVSLHVQVTNNDRCATTITVQTSKQNSAQINC